MWTSWNLFPIMILIATIPKNQEGTIQALVSSLDSQLNVHVICYRITSNLFLLENRIVAHMCKGVTSFIDIGISCKESHPPIIRLNLTQLSTRATHYLCFASCLFLSSA